MPTYVWEASEEQQGVPAAEPLRREYEVRRRALNDRVTVGHRPERELMNVEYTIHFPGDSLCFGYSDSVFALRKCMWSDSAAGLHVSYRIENRTDSQDTIRLALENGFCPALIEVMDHGRGSLCWWDGAAEQESVTTATVGVRNRAAGTTVSFAWESAPDSIAGDVDVFGLELNPVFAASVAPGEAMHVRFVLEAEEDSTGDGGGDDDVPAFRIAPNPFREGATIVYTPTESGWITLDVYSPGGRHIRRLEEKAAEAERNEFYWDGKDANGRRLGSGVYLVRLTTPSGETTRKVVRIR